MGQSIWDSIPACQRAWNILQQFNLEQFQSARETESQRTQLVNNQYHFRHGGSQVKKQATTKNVLFQYLHLQNLVQFYPGYNIATSVQSTYFLNFLFFIFYQD